MNKIAGMNQRAVPCSVAVVVSSECDWGCRLYAVSLIDEEADGFEIFLSL
jgi:hypothetical protein